MQIGETSSHKSQCTIVLVTQEICEAIASHSKDIGSPDVLPRDPGPLKNLRPSNKVTRGQTGSSNKVKRGQTRSSGEVRIGSDDVRQGRQARSGRRGQMMSDKDRRGQTRTHKVRNDQPRSKLKRCHVFFNNKI